MTWVTSGISRPRAATSVAMRMFMWSFLKESSMRMRSRLLLSPWIPPTLNPFSPSSLARVSTLCFISRKISVFICRLLPSSVGRPFLRTSWSFSNFSSLVLARTTSWSIFLAVSPDMTEIKTGSLRYCAVSFFISDESVAEKNSVWRSLLVLPII